MEEEKKKKNKTLKVVITVFRTIFFTLLVAFILVVCLQRFSNNKISFFNYRMFTVISGSMEPKYSVGDVLLAKSVEPSKIKVGDTVSYLGKNGSFANKVITHEVMKIEKDENNKFRFHTQGLTNVIEDPIVGEDQLYGVVVYRSVILSFLYGMIANGIGFYLFIVIPLFIVIGYEFVSSLLMKEAEKRSKK